MKNVKKVLIICDSHGASYGCKSYSELLKDSEHYNVDIQTFAGLSTDKVIKEMKLDNDHDYVIIQVGNPDVHPRMPRKLINKIKKVCPYIARDSLFSVPPQISLMYILRYPFFCIRRLVIKRMKKKEYMLSVDEVKNNLKTILERCSKNCKNIILFPLFEVDEKVYGKEHNTNAKIINDWLKENYEENFIDNKILNSTYYKKFYNKDHFHFTNEYHEELLSILYSIMSEEK